MTSSTESVTEPAVISGDGVWHQIPALPRPRPAGVLVRWLLVVVPLALALRNLDVDSWRIGCFAVIVGLSLPVADRLIRRPQRVLGVGLVAFALLAVVIGPRAAVMTTVSAAAWSLALIGFRRPAQGTHWRSYRPAVGPLVVADALLIAGGRVRIAAVLILLAGAICLVAYRAPSGMGRVADLGDRAGHRIAAVLVTIAMLPAATLVALMAGLYRLVGFDPLRPRRGTSRWRRRPTNDASPLSAAGPDSVDRLSRSSRGRRFVASAFVGVGALAALLLLLTKPPSAPTSAAFPESSWSELWAEQGNFNSRPSFDSTTVWRLDDFEGRHVNQRDGRRTTWRAPECDCVRRRIWWFGGSAAWGFYQADDQTIPSQIAQAAWKDGVALDFENFALPGNSLSQEMQLFAQLSVTEEPPDLAVFYDGANELFVQEFRNNRGEGTDESPGTYADAKLTSVMHAGTLGQRLWSRFAPGVASAPAPSDPLLDAPAVAGHAMERYRRQVLLTSRIAAAASIPVAFVWQPVRSTAPDAVAAEWDPMEPRDAEWHRRLAESGRRGLPEGVTDLSDVFDESSEPIFPDWAHTNGRGSAIVAASLVDQVIANSEQPARADKP